MDELKVELEMKKNDLKSVEEALDEIELFDEDEDIPFLFGEVFLSHKLSRTQVRGIGFFINSMFFLTFCTFFYRNSYKKLKNKH